MTNPHRLSATLTKVGAELVLTVVLNLIAADGEDAIENLDHTTASWDVADDGRLIYQLDGKQYTFERSYPDCVFERDGDHGRMLGPDGVVDTFTLAHPGLN